MVLSRLQNLRTGKLVLKDDGKSYRFGADTDDQFSGTVNVSDSRFYRSVVLGGDIGAAEAYIRGYWDSPDLTTAMRVLAANTTDVANVARGLRKVVQPIRNGANWLRRNTPSGSRRNISAHYDLSNDFFALMLDPTMTYSSGVFPTPESTLKEASTEKYDRICRKLQLSPGDRVVEIGTGWGGFAMHAAQNFGCHVTTTTISEQQHSFAAARFAEANLNDRITLLKQDYRTLSGRYDKLVSIEMIEAVGERFLPTYFEKCSSLLKPEGMMCLQAITIPDSRYDSYRSSVDFIQRYIFPGGFLPSIGVISRCLASRTDMTLLHSEDFGTHYARTLNHWRQRFWESIDMVRTLGFDQRFIRTWNYYLCYCEAGFQERQIGVSQILLTKPACRREPILMS